MWLGMLGIAEWLGMSRCSPPCLVSLFFAAIPRAAFGATGSTPTHMLRNTLGVGVERGGEWWGTREGEDRWMKAICAGNFALALTAVGLSSWFNLLDVQDQCAHGRRERL